MTCKKIIVHLSGGMGNQLFKYAAARNLALKNQSKLELDIYSGFRKDMFGRQFVLSQFNIEADIASRWDSYASVTGSIRRIITKAYSKSQNFQNRSYIIEEYPWFDERILAKVVKKSLYLHGFWQSEKYFKEIEDIIRFEFQIKNFFNTDIIDLSSKILSTNSICIHVRRFPELVNIRSQSAIAASMQLSKNYYLKGLNYLLPNLPDPHIFCFGDEPSWLTENINLKIPTTILKKNADYEDLWLMSQCKHFIIANSTFSWWGAWLSTFPEKVVVAPEPKTNKDFIPESWIKIKRGTEEI